MGRSIESKNQEIVWHKGQITFADRALFFRQKPITIWFTGLSGSGKSTLAFALESRLMQAGKACYVLDGDNVRHGLNRDLGFSPLDRKENIRRISEVARLMNDAGLIVITAFISPYREDREMARSIIGPDNFVEIHLNTPLETCEGRDTKGMYKKARTGEIPGFTGISSPYESPEHPTLTLDTGRLTIEECLENLLQIMGACCINGDKS